MPINLPRNGKLETVYLDFVYQAHKTIEGDVESIMAIATDVTPQVKMRQKIEKVVSLRTKELAEANSNLQKSNLELAQFAHIASHDLQEPLRKITIFTEMLEKNIGHLINNETVNFISKIRSSSKRMHNMINDILTYSELKNQTKAFTTTDLHGILEKSLIDYELLIEQKKAIVKYDKLPVINAVPMQMTQLFGNLINNSLKFSDKSRPLILTITVADIDLKEIKDLELDTNKRYIQLSFEDNGIGFPEEFKGQIFNIFNRLHKKTDYSGTGIGLAICKRIVQNHLGIINADGSSEKGAKFNVILPID